MAYKQSRNQQKSATSSFIGDVQNADVPNKSALKNDKPILPHSKTLSGSGLITQNLKEDRKISFLESEHRLGTEVSKTQY